MENRKKIFVSAYACEPDLGSEVGVGWHWVLEMSRCFDLWVLTRKSNRRAIENWRKSVCEGGNGVDTELAACARNIHFLYFDLPRWARWWKKGRRGVHLYYTLWQTFSNKLVRETMQREGIEIFHHLTYGNVLWKVSAYGQKCPYFIWGPVGGLETIPSQYTRYYSVKSRLQEFVRRILVGSVRFSFGFRQRCKNASLILCKTDITRQCIPAAYRDKAVLFTDVAVENMENYISQEPGKIKEHVDFLTVGRLEGWRGFDLVLEAFAKAKFEWQLRTVAGETLKPLHLTVMGNGPDAVKLQQHARQLGLTQSDLTFTGRVPMQTYRKFISGSDVVVNASLKEGAVTVSFDSLSLGKPLICLDTTGYTRYFDSDYSILIPRLEDGEERKREDVIASLSQAMLCLLDDELRDKMGENAYKAGAKFSWDEHGREICDIILKCVSLQDN
ncbi:MAG: glycosyltransferase family 4 protein [Bacteroidales bacterium]|nr:glycosyltransferase family 4 protein [Bacteroidales bacterium]